MIILQCNMLAVSLCQISRRGFLSMVQKKCNFLVGFQTGIIILRIQWEALLIRNSKLLNFSDPAFHFGILLVRRNNPIYICLHKCATYPEHILLWKYRSIALCSNVSHEGITISSIIKAYLDKFMFLVAVHYDLNLDSSFKNSYSSWRHPQI